MSAKEILITDEFLKVTFSRIIPEVLRSEKTQSLLLNSIGIDELFITATAFVEDRN